MTAQRTGAAEARPLDILGISEEEERAYSWLLEHSGATVLEIAQALATTVGKARRLLDSIEAKGLTTHAPERPRRYIPASPNIAVEALILQRQKDLQRARDTIQALQEQAAAARQTGGQEQMVELITSREAERQTFDQMQRTAQHEVITLTRLPVVLSRLDIPYEQDHRMQSEAQCRGVRCRSIVDSDFLALPHAVARVRNDMKAGEQVRVISHLPFKLVIVDRRIGIIPLVLKKSPNYIVLLVRASPLLDALYALFEMFWERAAPISFSRCDALEVGDSLSQLPEATGDLISLMATGLNDKKIADELRISQRTLERRIAKLMQKLGTRTRFQTGWLAALRLSGATLPPDT